MTDQLTDFWVHTVTIETFQGSGSNGDVFAVPVQVTGFMDGGQKVTRNTEGEMVVTTAPFYTSTDNAALFVPNSRLTFNGVQSRVSAVANLTSGGLGLPDHLEIVLG